MRRIGVLGGMSWESTAHYYRLLNEETARRRGGLHSAEVLLRSIDFAPVEAWQAAGEWDRLEDLLEVAATELAAGGAELLVLATNTMHRVAAPLEAAFGERFLHLGDVTAQAVLAADVRRVGLLGTRFTMEEAFYRDRLTRHGLEVVTPPLLDRQLVHRVIYDELCLGVLDPASRQRVQKVVRGLVAAGCEGVVLGCTELELLLTESGIDGTPLFPTTRLHCEAAVDAALDPGAQPPA